MQTFVAFPNFEKSASVLDSKRLFKQVLEGRQILETIINKNGWRYHPAVKQWVGYESCLLSYVTCVAEECLSRGINAYNQLRVINNLNVPVTVGPPPWFGDPKIHASHRSRLLCKGYVDAVCLGLKRVCGIKKMDDWLEEIVGKTKNECRFDDYLTLSALYKTLTKTPEPVNFYLQYGWTENPADPYVWPTNK